MLNATALLTIISTVVIYGAIHVPHMFSMLILLFVLAVVSILGGITACYGQSNDSKSSSSKKIR